MHCPLAYLMCVQCMCLFVQVHVFVCAMHVFVCASACVCLCKCMYVFNMAGYLLHIIITSDVLEHKWRASLKTILFLYE